VESEDTLDSALTIEKFQSERLKEIHPNYIGGNQTIVRSTPYYIEGVYYLGSGLIGENEIGGSPQDLLINSGFNIGQYSDVSHDYTIQDHYTRFNLDAFENNFSNSFVPNCQRINNFANNNVYIGSSGLGIGGILQDLYYPPTPDPIIQDLGIFTINPGVLINSINIGQHHTIIIQPPTPEPHISWPELNIGNQYFIGFNYIGNPPVIFNGIYPEPQYYEGYLSVNTQAETITEEVESVDLFSDYTSVSMYEKVFPKNIGGNESIVRIDPYTIQDGITRIGEIEIGVGDPYPDIQEEEVPLLLGEITIGDSSTLNGVRVIQIPITSYTYEDFIGISTKVPEVNIGGVHAVGEAKYKSSDYEVGDPYTKLNIDFEYQAFVEEFEINSPIILISEHNFITFDETLEIGESNIGDSEIGYYTNPPETIFITSNKNSIVDTLTYLDSQLTVTEEIESVDIIDNSLETCISEKVFNTLGSGEFIQGIPLAHVGVGSIGNIQIGPVELSPALNIGDAEVSWNDFIGPEYFTPNQKIKENGTDKISNIYISHSGFSEQFNLNNTEYFEFLQGSNLLYDTPLDGNTTYIELSLGDNPALIDPETGEVLLFDNGNDPEPWYIELVGHDGSYVWNPYDNPRNDILSNLNNIVVEDIISEYHTPIGEGVIWDVD
jgi:hypothetical protein